ncbi:MAG TPA: pyrimidine 5'-nucleotidase [Anaerolineaceae bacterium]|jgi:putative hydrolase of the HAD superfamily|nr:pyrimidine 5'-nucleotidase [Anaerolineaceae bacterium]
MTPVKTLLIDLDDTTYPTSVGVWPLITERVFQYMYAVVGIPKDEIPEKRDRLFLEHGTTMRGLNIEYGIDVEDYLQYVHEVDLSKVIQPDQQLRQVLGSLPQDKWIFTNASRQHADNVLGLLGIADLFMGVIDVLDTEPWCKPHPEAFEIALKLAGGPEPAETLFVDDLEVNLDAARALGLQTLRVSGQMIESNHPVINSLVELPTFLSNNGFKQIDQLPS